MNRHLMKIIVAACLPVALCLSIVGCSAPTLSPQQQAEKALSHRDLDLYLLIGQSNMAGRGVVEEEDRLAHPRVLTLNRENQWVPATDPIHFDKKMAGVGPGRSFGLIMANRNPSRTIGLVPCAVGGSSIRCWKPGGFHKQTNTHPYDDMLKRMQIARQNGTVKGILWHQGESDSAMGLDGTYEKKLIELIERLRQDLGAKQAPFVIGQLGEFQGRPWNAGRKAVDLAHKQVCTAVYNTGFVETKGFTDKGDKAHFDTPSTRELGRRFAHKMLELQRKTKKNNTD